MFQTLGYFLELSVSIYFFAVVMLFLINVCEFMPLTEHEGHEEEKVLIRTPTLPKAPAESEKTLEQEKDTNSRSKIARERWKSLPTKLPKYQSWGKLQSDPDVKIPGVREDRRKSAPSKMEEAPDGDQGPQETPADGGPASAPGEDGGAATLADDTPPAAPTDEGAAPAESAQATEDGEATG